jgi:hypothetical protein
LKTLNPKRERKSRRTDRFVFFLLGAQAALLNHLIRDEEEGKEDTERIFLYLGSWIVTTTIDREWSMVRVSSLEMVPW